MGGKKKPARPKDVSGGGGKSGKTYPVDKDMEIFREELIKDDTKLVGGSGLSLCDSNDNSKKSETNKALRNHQVLLAAHPEAVELAAIIQGLSWALKHGVKSIQFFCDDDSIILDYVTGKAAPPNESIVVAKLLKQLALLQALPLLRSDDDINSSLIKLARDAIASQTTWQREEGDEYETCPACYAHVSPRHKLEVRSGCFHRICFTCIRDCHEGTPYSALTPGCEKELVLEDCRGIVDDDALNLIIHRKKEKAINHKFCYACGAACTRKKMSCNCSP
ncbi:hypothetical protein HID58_084054 [Brassica napus]|uniref:RNase H type-1 domain-containing protein n=1 Tax=Brassica napus TaxID=3708 RepID=A0ABQ7XL05_BRANA|nr:hypothetical protein HID58_084054 [Brassica napus]